MSDKKIDLDELLKRAIRDATLLDGRHGDPSRYGNWIGHRDYARAVIDLIEIIRHIEAIVKGTTQ